MPIYRLLQQSAFSPEDVGRMATAFEQALRTLKLTSTDPLAETVAKKIVEIAQTGERNPSRLSAHALMALGQSSSG
jgi:hypothetical protein